MTPEIKAQLDDMLRIYGDIITICWREADDRNPAFRSVLQIGYKDTLQWVNIRSDPLKALTREFISGFIDACIEKRLRYRTLRIRRLFG